MAGSDRTGQLGSNDLSVITVTRFHYDALDRLIGRSATGDLEQRFYRNNELVTEINGADSTTFVRAEDVVLAQLLAGGSSGARLLVGDDKNSVLGEVSRQGITRHAYSPYGHLTDAASANSLLGYNGERREGQTGWYLLGKGYRVFNPLMMRFHGPDNLSPFGEGGLNAYMYCMGDPINHLDPTGHTPLGWLLRALRKTTSSADYLEDVSGIPRDL
ncbi:MULTISPECIES: RHS repeat-associated core domain-containing protein [unclassified Pseudomonas]|uniref:RHS repeat-associated core domain-containing protein n=1 Tax=unclassified Pseudomonas TaxID=196821 RepID=UPI0039B78C4C